MDKVIKLTSDSKVSVVDVGDLGESLNRLVRADRLETIIPRGLYMTGCLNHVYPHPALVDRGETERQGIAILYDSEGLYKSLDVNPIASMIRRHNMGFKPTYTNGCVGTVLFIGSKNGTREGLSDSSIETLLDDLISAGAEEET